MLNEDKIVKSSVKDFRLLTEWVNRNDVVDAINNRDIVYIYYSGDETVNRGYRTIEPYALGRSTAGNLVLRAWQQAGATDSGQNPKREADEIPGWRLFRLDGITTFMKTMKQFASDKNKIRPNYNPNDKGMTEVIVSVDPEMDIDVEISGTDSINQPDVIKQKIDTFEPQAAKFRNFYDAARNKQMLTKKAVGDIYNYVKLQQKKDPSNFIVTNKDGRVWYDKAENEENYEQGEVLGNLNNLFRKLYDVKTFKIDKNFIEKQRQDFINALKNEVES